MPLFVVLSTSFSLTQLLPASALRMLFRLLTLALVFMAWFLKLRSRSRVTPRIFGSCTVGTAVPAMVIGIWVLASFDQVVNRVAEDLGAEIKRLRLENQVFRVSR